MRGLTGPVPGMTRFVLLWHPAIHEFYDETLHFFVLRFRGYTRSTLLSLLDSLKENGIVGVSMYEIFGAYDVLMRVWLTPAMLRNLDHVFERVPQLATYSLFRVHEIRHWAFRTYPQDVELARLLGSEELSIADIQDRVHNGDTTQLGELEAAEIAKCIPHGPNDKFYSALMFREFDTLSRQQEETIRSVLFEIHEQASSTEQTVRNLVVHIGEGFAHVLIEGVAENIYEARHFLVDSVLTGLRGMFPEVTTFTSCESEPYQSDDISADALRRFHAGTPPLWIKAWFPEFYRIARNPSILMEVQSHLTTDRKRVQALTEEYKRDLLRPVLHAVLTRSPGQAVTAVLPWFARVEGMLRSNKTWFGFLGALSGETGKALQKSSVEVCEGLGLDLRSQKEITLGDRLNLYLAALKKYAPDSPLLGVSLQPAELTRVRNEFAHGVMYERFVDSWQEVYELLMWFIPVYEGILVRVSAGSAERQEQED